MQTIDTDIALDKIISTIGELPASPTIVSTVMGLTSNLDAKVVDISKVLSADQALTAKVLKLSNSSYYGRSKDVKTLQEAILILGFFTVRSLVIATSAHKMYQHVSCGRSHAKLWRHSLATALAARQIAKQVRHPEEEEIFVAALLHDIGKLVMLQKMPDAYQRIVADVEANSDIFLETEMKELGFSHCDVGAILLEQWSFPSSLTGAVRDHHQSLAHRGKSPATKSSIVNLGNFMAKKLGVGFFDRSVDDLSELESAHALSIDKETIDRMLEIVNEQYQIELRILEEI